MLLSKNEYIDVGGADASQKWVADSSASYHITHTLRGFKNIIQIEEEKIVIRNGQEL